MGKNFLGLDGLKHFWSKAKSWIAEQITAEVTAKIAKIVANAPEDLDTLKEIAGWISTHEDSASAMNSAILSNTEAISGKADKRHTHTKSQITDFPTSLKNPNALTVNGKTYDGSEAVDAGVQKIENGGTGATTALGAFESLANGLPEGAGPLDTEHIIFQNENRKNWGLYTLFQFWEYIKSKISSVLGLTKDSYGGKSAKSSFLDEYVGAGGTRPTSGNLVPKDTSEYGGMRKDVITSSMTDSGHPGQDGHLLTMFWDNSGRYDSQLFVSNEKQPTTVKVRVKANEADYGPWVDLITSQNIGSQTVASAGNADKAVDVIDYGDTSRIVRIGYQGPGVTADKLLYLAGYTEHTGSSVKLKDVNKEEIIKWLGIPRIKYADYQTPTQAFTQFEQVPIELSKFSSEVTPNNVLCFMVIYWMGVKLIASADWGNENSSGLKCALIALQAGTGNRYY